LGYVHSDSLLILLAFSHSAICALMPMPYELARCVFHPSMSAGTPVLANGLFGFQREGIVKLVLWHDSLRNISLLRFLSRSINFLLVMVLIGFIMHRVYRARHMLDSHVLSVLACSVAVDSRNVRLLSPFSLKSLVSHKCCHMARARAPSCHVVVRPWSALLLVQAIFGTRLSDSRFMTFRNMSTLNDKTHIFPARRCRKMQHAACKSRTQR
jgi:hypothetical protein